jgi:hypothetical protein
MKIRFTALALFALAVPAAAETVESPQYKGWAGWKPGATVTMTSEAEAAGMKMTLTMTGVLKSVSAEKAVVESSSSSVVGGMKIDVPPAAVDVPARNPKVAVEKVLKEIRGKETLTINGTALACEWVKEEIEGGEVRTTWYSADVPGGVVKGTSKSDGLVTTSIVTAWKGEKK